jgi:hypothetical protein
LFHLAGAFIFLAVMAIALLAAEEKKAVPERIPPKRSTRDLARAAIGV